MLNFIVFIIALAILVTVHEGGHFLAAKFFGVYVEKFSIGFGPKLLGFKYKNTEYILSLLPLGGYVKMKAENPNEKIKYDDDEFLAKSWWKRFIIAFSGPFANLILAVFLFSLMFMIGKKYEDHKPVFLTTNKSISNFIINNDKVLEVNGKKVKAYSQVAEYTNNNTLNEYKILRNKEIITIKKNINKEYFLTKLKPKAAAIIGDVMPGLPAYTAGLKANDVIVKIDTTSIYDWYQMQKIISLNKKNVVDVTIKRKNEFIKMPVNLNKNILSNNSKMMGISIKLPVTVKQQFGFLESIKNGSFYSVAFLYANYKALYSLITKPKMLKDSIGGPVMIYSMSNNSVKKGLDSTISLFASLSLILMFMNLLPIPVLDGGQMLFCVIEGIMQKPLSLNIQANLQKFGFLLLLSLMFFAFYNDFGKLFKRVSSSKNHKTVEVNK